MALRVRALDGALLGFDPSSGLSVRVRGPATAALRARAPRAVQIAVTNHCNLACGFCYREQSAASEWTVDALVTVLEGLDRAGVLEVAFGGGEPFAFKGFGELLERLRATHLAVSITTNGELVDAEMLERIRDCYAELRLSLYDGHESIVDRFVAAGARFGVNLLVTPARLPHLATQVVDLVRRGVTDVLLLSYNGEDASLHLSRDEMDRLARTMRALERLLRGRASLKLSVCFGERLEAVPRVFNDGDCGAGVDFVAIGSDRTVRACSFHHEATRVESAEDVLRVYRDRSAMLRAARIKGCARLYGHGLDGLLRQRRRAPVEAELTRVHVYRAFASNNSGSYTLVGYVPSRELAVETAQEIARVCAEYSAWIESPDPEKFNAPSPLAAFAQRFGLSLTDNPHSDDWPSSGGVGVTSVGHQVVLHVDYTVTMPPLFGELLYKRGGGVSVVHDHSHDALVVLGRIWSERLWRERVAPEILFKDLRDELGALLPQIAARGRSGEHIEPAWPQSDHGLEFAIVLDDLVAGISALDELVARHGASLHVNIVEPPVPSHDPLEAWRHRGKGEGRYQVVLWRIGDDRIAVMKVVRDRMALGLDEVKKRIELLPMIVADGLSLSEARGVAETLREAGADATAALV